MQTIKIQDEIYQNLNKYSLDPNIVLSQVVSNIENSQFYKDRDFFKQCLNEIKNHKVELLSHNGVWESIDKSSN